ncbi:hypothetical protein CLOM_g13550 [Closterium sp. NIES-68]|nr:hypothetical protein CLOM_g13550 [Closterium sp. NIES-68]GJP68299.1 hypothetical protein CLOP_g25028 [Closterium sp. NIES-67]
MDSTSPFVAPILFIPKEDGGLRMCIDYRALNQVTIKSRYPIPHAEELIDQLRGANFFSKIDLRGDYHQIYVNETDYYKTAFQTWYRGYEYTVMPFGLTNAPSTFKFTMNEVFLPLVDKCVIVRAKLSVHNKELLAIVHSFKIWHCYLRGADVIVRTDHKSLQFIRALPTLNPQQIRWLDYLSPHRRRAYYLKSCTSWIWVSAYRTLRELLIQEAHDSNFSGHYGIDKTAKLLRRNYNWPDLPRNVQLYVTSCATYQRMKSFRLRHAGLLQPLEPPSRPWQQVTMDFVTGLPAGPSGNDAIFVVIDRLTKMAHFAACRTTITAEQIGKLFLTNIVRLHGIPSAIISNRDPWFTSNFWTKTLQQYGTRLHLSAAYHPQSDGQTERICMDPRRHGPSRASG